MPMKLNLKERTTVTPEFEASLKELWKQRWVGLNNDIKCADPRFKDAVVKKNGRAMGLLRAYCTDPKAYDQQKTQLMTLPYLKFWTLERGGMSYLAGLTKPILLTNGGEKRWQGPRFTVYIPTDYITRGTEASYHFVPEGHELVYGRHPHHTSGSRREETNGKSPLDFYGSTCWGEFPTIVRGCVHSADTINLFRTIHLYLTRYNPSSPLCHGWESDAGFKPL
jgi:hypothetical protein